MGKKDKKKKEEKAKKKKKKKDKKKKLKDPLIAEQIALDESSEDDPASILDHIQPSFIEEGARLIGVSDLVSVIEAREELTPRFDPEGTLGHFHDEAMLMISLLEDYRTGHYTQTPFWSVAVMAFGLKYVLKPIDIIPDNLPLIGQLDDTMVVAHCVEMVRKDLLAYKVQVLTREER